MYAKITLDDSEYNNALDGASEKTSSFASKLGSGLSAAAKVGAAAITAAGAAVVALGKIGIDYNTQMETYTTNFEVMMGDAEAAALKVEELKEMGAKTPFELGDLANATQTLLAFNVSADESTDVLQKLGDISLGDAQKLETLTRAYGKMNSSQKVTLEDINMMIDSGFNPLLLIAEDTGETMEELYDRISKGGVSFDEMSAAIDEATSAGGQFYEGMAKASQTTEGLISTLKDNVTALIGEVYAPISEGLTSTVLPSAIEAIGTLSEAFRENGVEGMITAAGEMLGGLIGTIAENAPKVIDAGVSLVESIINGMSQNLGSITTGAIEIITAFIGGIMRLVPQILQLGIDLLSEMVTGIVDGIPDMIERIPAVIEGFVDFITENLPKIIELGTNLLISLTNGIIGAIPSLVGSLPELINSFVNFIATNLPLIIQSGVSIVANLVIGLIQAIPQIVAAIPDLITAIVEGVNSLAQSVINIGSNIVNWIKDGITAAWGALVEWVSAKWSALMSIFSFSGSVSGISAVDGSHAGGLDYVPFNGYVAELHRGETVLTADEAEDYREGKTGGRAVNIVQNIYSEAKTAADLMQEALYLQERAVLLGV